MKKLGIKHALVMGVAVFALFTTQAAPAGAATAGALVVTGTGTITPGLRHDPLPQTFNFTSVPIQTVGVRNNAPNVLGSSTCGANGASLVPENVLVGAGRGRVTCTGGDLAGLAGDLAYVRVGAAVAVVIVSPTIGAVPNGAAGLGCVFIPSTRPPAQVTNYSLICAGAGALAEGTDVVE